MRPLRFFLFSKIPFQVTNPIALIESYCFQTDFYSNFDIIPLGEKRIEDVNKIGARISKELLNKCSERMSHEINPENLGIFHYDLDGFLGLDTDDRNRQITDFNEKAVKKLLRISGIRLSKATKILHTLHPRIIPMIDNPLQDLYREEIDEDWTEGNRMIFVDYYKNFEKEDNWKNLGEIHKIISKMGHGLTKVRVFDILWWSFLKAKRLKEKQRKIQWSTIKWQNLQCAQHNY